MENHRIFSLGVAIALILASLLWIPSFNGSNSEESSFDPPIGNFQPPIADAGLDQTVNEGQVVYFNGLNSYESIYNWHQLNVNFASDSALYMRTIDPLGPHNGAWEGGVMEWVTFTSANPFWIGKQAGHLGQGPTGKTYTYYWKMHETDTFTLTFTAGNGYFTADVYDETTSTSVVSGIYVNQETKSTQKQLYKDHVYRLDVYSTFVISSFVNDLDVKFQLEETEILLTPDKDSLVYYIKQNPLELGRSGPGVTSITFFSRDMQQFYAYYIYSLVHSEDTVSGGELDYAPPPYNTGITPGEYYDNRFVSNDLIFLWDLDADVDADGDGNFTNDMDAVGPLPSHAYGDDGEYTVTLNVSIYYEGEETEKVDQDVIFCCDTSGSMSSEAIMFMKEGLNIYVDEMEIPDQGAVVKFGGNAVLMNPLTDDYVQLKNDISNLPNPSGGTPMVSALQIAISEIQANGIPGHTKAIILLTDGQPTDGSDSDVLDMAYIAEASDIVIYTIGLEPASGFGGLDEDLLQDIADITGGEYFYAPDPGFLATIYQMIANIVDNPYGDQLWDLDTMIVSVDNKAPSINQITSPTGPEGSLTSIVSIATDPGSDDLTFTWDWGDGSPTESTTYYNDGMGPDSYPSPGGTFPFSAVDEVDHTYGDDGIYTVSLDVTDDDGGIREITTTVSVSNVAPTVTFSIMPSGDEGSAFSFDAQASDPGSDDIEFSWDLEYGPTLENTYYNNGVGPEPDYDPGTNEIKSPQGVFPFVASDSQSHTYGDDYNYTVLLTVTDDDGGEATYSTTVSINNIAPSISQITIPTTIDEGSLTSYQVTASDPGSDDITINWNFEHGPVKSSTFYNDGIGPDSYPSPDGNFPFEAADSVDHTYGDNGLYLLELTLTDDDGGTTTFTANITVYNVAPTIDPFGPFTLDEASPIDVSTTFSDPGSDDVTVEWEWQMGPSSAATYYNDGVSADPLPSPWGTFPFSITDNVGHTYGDNGVYILTVTCEDDDGDIATYSTNVTINNVAPTIEPFGPFEIDEGTLIDITTTSWDLGSDDLTFTWDFELHPTITGIHYNDGVGPDPMPSPDGIYPCSAVETCSAAFADDGNLSIILTVTDDDGGMAVYETYVLVSNVAPSILSVNYTASVINEPRTVGYWGHQCVVDEPYGEHTGILQEWVDEIASQSQVFSGILTKDDVEDVVQFGNAQDMIVMAKRQLMGVWLNVVSGKLHPQSEIQMPNLTASKTVMEAILEIENVILTSSNRSELERVKDIADSMNNGIGIAIAVAEFTVIAQDPGADDLTFTWDFGDGESDMHFYPNLNGTYPVEITDIMFHSYFFAGTFDILLTVSDDDGGVVTYTVTLTLP